MGNSEGRNWMVTSEAGQSSDGYGILIGFLSFIGLVVGIVYMWLFKRPFPDALYILPIAVIGTILLFALFVIIIKFIQE